MYSNWVLDVVSTQRTIHSIPVVPVHSIPAYSTSTHVLVLFIEYNRQYRYHCTIDSTVQRTLDWSQNANTAQD